MKQLFLTRYTFRDKLDEVGYRELVKKFGEIGESPGTIAHYVTLDGRGGFTITDHQDVTGVYETVLAYSPYIDFETIPITTMADALPSILKFYG